MTTATKGRHVWYELLTGDVDAAIAFYTETIGWKTSTWDEGEMPYTMWMVGDRSIGGVMALPEEAKKMGAPNHWIAHIATDDVDATAKQAESLGGTLLNTVEIPKVGRFAIIKDPQGAVFSAFKPENEMTVTDDPALGDMSWHELNSTDWEAGWKFYSALFGWKETDKMDMGPEMGTYFMFRRADGDEKSMIGGMSNAATMMKAPAHWLYYSLVDDINAAVERIKAKGGKILNGPMEIPGGDMIAQCMDPQGAAFAIHARKK